MIFVENNDGVSVRFLPAEVYKTKKNQFANHVCGNLQARIFSPKCCVNEPVGFAPDAPGAEQCGVFTCVIEFKLNMIYLKIILIMNVLMDSVNLTKNLCLNF